MFGAPRSRVSPPPDMPRKKSLGEIEQDGLREMLWVARVDAEKAILRAEALTEHAIRLQDDDSYERQYMHSQVPLAVDELERTVQRMVDLLYMISGPERGRPKEKEEGDQALADAVGFAYATDPEDD